MAKMQAEVEAETAAMREEEERKKAGMESALVAMETELTEEQRREAERETAAERAEARRRQLHKRQ